MQTTKATSPVLLLLTVVGLIMTAMASCSPSREFADLKGDDNIEVIHIPRVVSSLTGALLKMDGEKDDAAVLKGFKSLDVITCESREGRDKVYRVLNKALESSNSELMIEVREGPERTVIYGVPDTIRNEVRDLTIIDEEPAELSVVHAKGTFSITKLLNDYSTIK